MEDQEKEFVLSLSMTSWLSYNDVDWLFRRLKKDKKLTEQFFNIWSRTCIHPSDYLPLLGL